MPTTGASSEKSEKQIGRNEPCPCGSGKKFKRCCGKTESVDYSVNIKSDTPRAPGGMDMSALSQMAAMNGMDPSQFDPEMMSQVSNAMRRMPRGQLQRLQAIMQKAMSGKDVTKELAQFQSALPPDLQQSLAGAAMAEGMLGQMGNEEGTSEDLMDAYPEGVRDFQGEADLSSMDLEDARRIVEEAARSGEISEEQAAQLLSGATESSSSPGALEYEGYEGEADPPADAGGEDRKKSGFWKKLTGRE